ncbi:MAG: hypothetical protein JSV90_05640 [Methanobacteriota archaeon]|nr:MAG: hypothetical protein JSV90_05640 [Euryarchaeota archaeon]
MKYVSKVQVLVGKLHSLWDGIGDGTRFIVMGRLTRRRSMPNARNSFIGAKEQIGGEAP